MNVYDINGTTIANFKQNCIGDYHVDYKYDEISNANYTVIRIFKKKTDGTVQFPFVYAPNGTGAGKQSTLQMNSVKTFPIAINAGLFYVSGTDIGKPRGTVIQNSQVIKQETPDSISIYILTVDESGNLGYADRSASGSELVQNGIVSAVCGWAPIIINYDDATLVIPDAYDDQTNAQRQIIGQFGNGDYAILTCEGRDYDHSDGWTMNEARAICKKLGLKFAYNLDGGGSTETVVGKKQINTIYEGTHGRIVPTYIVFNGTNIFEVPN